VVVLVTGGDVSTGWTRLSPSANETSGSDSNSNGAGGGGGEELVLLGEKIWNSGRCAFHGL